MPGDTVQQRPEAEPEECAEAELEECHATAEPEEYYAPAEPEEDAVAQSEEHPADDPDQADDPAGLLRTRRGHSKSDPMCRVLDTHYIYSVASWSACSPNAAGFRHQVRAKFKGGAYEKASREMSYILRGHDERSSHLMTDDGWMAESVVHDLLRQRRKLEGLADATARDIVVLVSSQVPPRFELGVDARQQRFVRALPTARHAS